MTHNKEKPSRKHTLTLLVKLGPIIQSSFIFCFHSEIVSVFGPQIEIYQNESLICFVFDTNWILFYVKMVKWFFK